MLPKKYRLPANQIPEVLKRGQHFTFPLFNIVVLGLQATHYKLQISRFAFVVSNKVSKKAVVRNRTKRLLSESVRLLMSQVKKGQEIIFFAKKPFQKEKLQDILPQVEKALKSENLYLSGKPS